MVAVVWTLVAVIIAGMAGFFFDARSDRRDLKKSLEQMNTKIDQQGAETRAEIAELRAVVLSTNARIDQVNSDMNARIDHVIMSMATKEDVTELRADIHRVDDKLVEHLHQHGPIATRQTA